MAEASPTPPQTQDHLAIYLAAELEQMRANWKALIDRNPNCPPWTWEDVSEALLGLTESPVGELVVRGGLSGLVKQACFKPPELVLDELIHLARATGDILVLGSAREMLEAEMP